MADIFGLDSPSDSEIAPLHPIESTDFEDSDTLLEWSKRTFNSLKQAAIDRHWEGRDNLCRYRGYYQKTDPIIGSRNNPGEGGNRSKWPKVMINHTRDLVDQKVAKTLKIEPDTIVVPSNQETQDKVSSLTADKVLKSIKYRYDFNNLRARQLRRAIIWGESYFYVRWNPETGGWKSKDLAKIKGQISPNSYLRNIINKDGDEHPMALVPMMGDADISLHHNEHVYLIPGQSESLRDCPGVLIVEFQEVSLLRRRYPDIQDEILPTSDTEIFNVESLELDMLWNQTMVFKWYFRSTPTLPNGMYFSCTADVILDEPQVNPIPYSVALESSETGNLPIVRITDYDLDGYLYGWSSMSDINQLQVIYDKLTSWIIRNIFLFTSPKWMLPRGAAPIEQLGNGALVCQFSGPSAPQLATYNAVTQDVLAAWGAFEEKMGKIFGVYQLSRGEAPTGTRSASQLMIYDEQEEETRSTFRKKVEQMAVSVDAKLLSIVAANYKDSDGRLAIIVGEHQDWIAEPFKVEDLNKGQVIRVKPSTALPDNKYARIRTMLEISQYAPGVFTPQQLAEALDFGQQEKYLDYARVAVMAAETENELFQAGKDVEDPELFEDLLNHWKVHAKMLQNRQFKMWTEPNRQRALDHVGATEYLMFLQSEQNPTFKQIVMTTLPLFPLVYVMPDPVPGLPGVATASPEPSGPPPNQNGNGAMPMRSPGEPEPRDPSQRQPTMEMT